MASGEQISYEVTSVAPDTQFTAGNQTVPGKRVSYSTSSGYTGWVFVPDSVFADTAAVQRMIHAEVMIVYRAQQITGSIG